MPVTVSAPGKLMIAGEYAVLDGAEAIVAAVGRRAYATLAPRLSDSDVHAHPTLPMEALATRLRAEARVGSQAGELSIDTSELRAQRDGSVLKLGLGSSAAAAAAVAGAVYAAAGRDLRDEEVRRELLEVALEGHRSIAPDGSGADVAAAVLGGFVRFRRLGKSVETHALRWPEAVPLVVVWTGRAVRTSDMLTAVGALAQREPELHRARMLELGQHAEQLVSAVMAGDAAGTVAGLDAYGAAMGSLGKAAQIPILDDITEKIRVFARECGGAAKPSGAGGGDVVIAGFEGVNEAATFRAGCTQQGFELLSLDLGVDGERLEQ